MEKIINHVDLYVTPNKKLDKYILYNYIVVLRYILNEQDIKTTSLEWTLPSPPPAHTFAVAPKIITTAKHYADYRWGAVSKKYNFNVFPLAVSSTRYNIDNLHIRYTDIVLVSVHIFYKS